MITIRQIYDRKIEFARSDNKNDLIEFIEANSFIGTTKINELDSTIYLEADNSSIEEIKDCINVSISQWYKDTLEFDPFLLYNILQLSTNSCMIKI